MKSTGIHFLLSRREAVQQFAGLAGVAAIGSLGTSAAASCRSKIVSDFYEGDVELTQASIKVEKITDNIYMLVGFGGNIAVLTGNDDILQVDSGNKGTTPAVLTAIKGFTPKPVTTLINTHWHGDHTGGNLDTAKQGAKILAHENVRARLSSDQFIEAFNSKVPASPEGAWPVVTFDDRLTIHHGGETLKLHHVLPAHTDSDIIVHFEKANVVHAGDLFFNGMYPFIDSSTGGWIGGMVKAADKILSSTNGETKIIPGHGKLGNKAEFRQYRDMLATVEQRITPLVKSGKTADEVVAAKPLASLDNEWGQGFMKPEVFVKIVYTGIKKFGKV